MKTLYMILLASFLIPATLTSQPYFQKITTGPVATNMNYSHSSAWGDYDNDGDQDLVVTSFNDNCWSCNFPILFYRNNGDETFTRIYDNAVAMYTGITGGLCWGDYDNDSYLDLFICGHLNAKNLLFHNERNGNFTKITSGPIVNDIAWSQCASWADYDRDGWIDLFVANRLNQKNFLYKNNRNGTFTKVIDGAIVNDIGASRCCSWGDYDNDGWQDLFVLNYEGINDFLYHNNGDGTFTRIFNEPLVNDGQWGSSCSWSDYDNDGYLDLFVTNNGSNNKLYHNNGNGHFNLVTNILSQEGDSYGFSWGDYNNDGLIDIVVTNFTRTNTLYRNDGNSVFTKVTNEVVSQEGPASLTAAWSDFNNNGKLDLLLANSYGTPFNFFYKNIGQTGNYITFRVIGCISNRAAIGATVKVYKGSYSAIRIVSGGDAYSQNMLWLHFGLGTITQLDSVVVEWPYPNLKTVYRNLLINQTNYIKECPRSTGISENSIPEKFFVSQNFPNPFNPSTNIEFGIPEKSFVSLRVYDISGKIVSTLVNEYKNPGQYKIEFSSTNTQQLSSGIYFYKLTSGSHVFTRAMTFLK